MITDKKEKVVLVDSHLTTAATKELEQNVKDELEIKDPPKGEADKAIAASIVKSIK